VVRNEAREEYKTTREKERMNRKRKERGAGTGKEGKR
jgi:hypothetical protein